MTEDQFKRLLAEMDRKHRELLSEIQGVKQAIPGHFWVLILLLAIAIKTEAC